MKRVFFTYREMKRRLEDFYSENQAKIDAIPVLKEILMPSLRASPNLNCLGKFLHRIIPVLP